MVGGTVTLVDGTTFENPAAGGAEAEAAAAAEAAAEGVVGVVEGVEGVEIATAR